MKSVGEVMGIGRTFKEALQKTVRSLEQDFYGFDLKDVARADNDTVKHFLAIPPRPERLFYIAEAYRRGFPPGKLISDLTKINRWFLDQIEELIRQEESLARAGLNDLTPPAMMLAAKENGFSDRRIAALAASDEETVRRKRLEAGSGLPFAVWTPVPGGNSRPLRPISTPLMSSTMRYLLPAPAK